MTLLAASPEVPLAPAPPGRWRALAEAWPALLFAFAFRGASYAAMSAVALWAERRPAPTVPDAVLGALPYVAWVDRANYWLWLAAYLPLTLLFLGSEPRRWARYMVTGGLVSLARGACIAMTGLGPPDPAHAGPGAAGHGFVSAFLDLLSPWAVFARGSAAATLTKDLFFSGHTATTFLLILYLRERPRLLSVAVTAHVAVVVSVLLAHIHYAIDVAGAYAFTFAIYVVREGWAKRHSS